MKILLCVPGIRPSDGGIQAFSRFLAESLQDAGNELLIVSKHDAARLHPDFPFARFAGCGSLPPVLRTAAFCVCTLLAGLLLRPKLALSTHINFSPLLLALKHLIGLPYQVIAHGGEVWGLKNTFRIHGLRKAQRIVAVSDTTRTRLIAELSLQSEHITILPNTYDASRFRPGPKPAVLLERYSLEPSDPVILTIGRLWSVEAEKGHDRIMRCLPELRKSFPRIRYLIGGRGDDRKRLEKLAADLDVNDRVTFCGFIHDEELCTHYNLCDIYAMPSTQEGFGIVYLEAMACGKPVLGSNADAAVDALCHGDLGFLVDPQDTGALSGILSGIFSGKYASDPRTDSARLTSEVRSRFGPEKFRENVARLWPSRPFQAHR